MKIPPATDRTLLTSAETGRKAPIQPPPPETPVPADKVEISAAAKKAGADAALEAQKTPEAAATSADPALSDLRDNAGAARTYNQADREALLAAWGSSAGQDRFATEYDLNSDGVINASDLSQLLGSFSETSGGEAVPTVDGFRAVWGRSQGEEGFNAAYDLNSDGVINAADLAQRLGGATAPVSAPATSDEPAAPTIEQVLAAFGRRAGEEGFDENLDVDGDGVVNAADLAQVLGSQRGPATAQELQRQQLKELLDAFGSSSGDDSYDERFDYDSDGTISAADLAELLGRIR